MGRVLGHAGGDALIVSWIVLAYSGYGLTRLGWPGIVVIALLLAFRLWRIYRRRR